MSATMNAPQAASENCLPVGTRLSDFEITGVLGEGGFGIVYLAFDHALQRTVAIKEYMPGMLAARGSDHSVQVRSERNVETFNVGLKSFINEARFLAQFDHPSLVKVYRYWEQNRTAYTAMKYYEGRTVKDIVTNSPEQVNETWCRGVIRHILDALELLYTMNIVHRDISPDNIIVQEDGEAVLLDFGSARQILGDAARGLTVILKPGYAPVEQYADDASLEQGPYTDIYALSAVMYFAIVGEPPATSIARMVKDPLVPLGQRAPDGYSAEFLIAIDKGLAVLAAERPQTIDAFRALLGIQEPSAPRPKMPAPPHRFATVERVDPAANFGAIDPDQTVLMPPPRESTAPAAVTAPAAAASVSAPAASTEWPVTEILESPSASPSPPPAPRPVAPRPRWLVPAAGALGLLSVVGLTAWLLAGDPDEVIKPMAQPAKVDTPAVAAATPAPAAAAPAPSVDAVLAGPAPADAAPAAPPAPAKEKVPDELALILAEPEGTPATDADKPPVQGATYRLAIRPWGTVFVDGNKIGMSPPLKELELTPGRHRIKVVNPGFPEWQTTVNVKPGQSRTISHHFAASSQF